jgi:hypothetical protein
MFFLDIPNFRHFKLFIAYTSIMINLDSVMFPYVLTIPVLKVVDGGIYILQLVTEFLDPALCRSTPNKEQRVASLDLFSLSGEMVGVPIS